LLARHHDAPQRAIFAAYGVKTFLLCHHGFNPGVGRARAQVAFHVHLKRHLGCILLQHRCVRHIVVVPLGMHHQQGSRLRQMAVEQFIHFGLRIAQGKHPRSDPDDGGKTQRQQQQPGLQRERLRRFHVAGTSRCTT